MIRTFKVISDRSNIRLTDSCIACIRSYTAILHKKLFESMLMRRSVLHLVAFFIHGYCFLWSVSNLAKHSNFKEEGLLTSHATTISKGSTKSRNGLLGEIKLIGESSSDEKRKIKEIGIRNRNKNFFYLSNLNCSLHNFVYWIIIFFPGNSNNFC